MTELRVLTLNGTPLPEYATSGSVGLDLRAAEHITIPPKEWKIISTGLKFEVPENHEVQIRSRSGLAFKGITVMNQPGTIDTDFRGEIRVILHNNNPSPWVVYKGDRIAQAVVSPVTHVEVRAVSDISVTSRGESGLGSTGER